MVRRANEPAAVVGILIISGIAALYMSKRATRTLETLDWRFRTILFTTIASLVITLFIYAAGIWRDVATFSGAAFAAWFSGVLFFAFVGAVVAAVSVIQPEQESFDSRARILFRRQYGPHIDYIVTKLKSVFEQYAQETNTKFIIDRYHDGERKYRVRTQDETVVRSYLEDVRTTYHSAIELTEVTLPPQGEERNRLSFVRIGALAEPGEPFDDRIGRPVSTDIEPFGTCLVAHEMVQWSLAGTEPFEHTTARYTNRLSITFENHLARELKISFKTSSSPNWQQLQIQPGERTDPIVLRDLAPESAAYEFKILPP